MAKQITIRSYHHGRSHDYTGTVNELATRVFGYTLECGHSWNHKISLHPKSGKALVNALNKSVAETQGSCYDPYSYELIG